jgi:3-isopropylmalate dehydratase small subunit
MPTAASGPTFRSTTQLGATCGNRSYAFTIDPVRRTRLLEGWDDIALTESYRHRSPLTRNSE